MPKPRCSEFDVLPYGRSVVVRLLLQEFCNHGVVHRCCLRLIQCVGQQGRQLMLALRKWRAGHRRLRHHPMDNRKINKGKTECTQMARNLKHPATIRSPVLTKIDSSLDTTSKKNAWQEQ
jgi:hypothetical protein